MARLRYMTVQQLRDRLATMPDDAAVLVPAYDHSYRRADAQKTTALYNERDDTWTEDYGEESTSEAEYGKRLVAVVFS